MKNLIFFLVLGFIACNQPAKPIENKENTPTSDYWTKLEVVKIFDDSGELLCTQVYPASWQHFKNSPDGVSIKGPNNIKLSKNLTQSFSYYADSYMRDFMINAGQNVRAFSSAEKLIFSDLVPHLQNYGLSYTDHQELSEISKINQWYTEQLFNPYPTEKVNKVYGVNFKNSTGQDVFAFFQVGATGGGGLQNWFYTTSLLEADEAVFENAKKQMIFSYTSTRFNLAAIMAHNKREAQKHNMSWQIFNDGMAARQAAFDAQQRAHINRSNAVNDAIMSGWKSQSEYSDKSQERFLDYIYELENVHSDENTYKVEYGHNQYWMNSDGEYIATGSSTYNPNLDENLNQEKWKQLKKSN